MLSSLPDTLGLYFCLLASSITDFDRKGMLLYKHPWDSVLNLEMLTLTRPETENMEENKIGVNRLHISKSFVITKEGWKQFLSRRKRQQKAAPSIQYSGSSIQHWSRMDPEPAARRPAPGLHGICLGNGKNQKTGQGELQVAHPEASIYKQDIVCPKASCKWEYSEAGCSKRSLAPSPSRHLEKLTICSAQNEERLLGMEEARNSEGDSAVFNLCYLQWMLFSLWPGLPPHLAHPPPLWHLTANRKKTKRRPGVLSYPEQRAMENCLSTVLIEKLHGVAGRAAKSRLLHSGDISKVKVGCKGSAGIKLSLRQAALHKQWLYSRE